MVEYDVLMYKTTKMQEKLNHKRQRAGCDVITDKNGVETILIAGGDVKNG